MKHLFIILIIISFKSKAQFHVKVEIVEAKKVPSIYTYNQYWAYIICFTKDNWKHQDTIRQANQITSPAFIEIAIWTDKLKAIKVAEGLNTYSKCFANNNKAKAIVRKDEREHLPGSLNIY